MRNRIRKTNIGTFTDEQMKRAVKLVCDGGFNLRAAAAECNVNHVTLYRYVQKQKVAANAGLENEIRFTPKYQSRLIFTKNQEQSLVDYLVTCSKMCYGKSTRDTRELAYEMATLNDINVPPNWHKHAAAGLDWMRSFLKRNPTLAIRQPEKCSLSRCTSFNPHTVNTFYDNLEAAMQRSESYADGSRIWNLDETATSTVVNKSVKVIAEKGGKGIATVAAGEKGTLVTTCCFVSATGNTIPPALVFPRVKFRDHMLINGPPGSLGLASKSGWMTVELFPQVIKHFIKHTLTSKENPTLLIMDNHQSHISLEVINVARDSGITIVTLPPHCSGKLQPLDVSCYAPFKAYYAAAVDSWQKMNPGKVLSIYDIAGCVNQAHQKAMIPTTIINGFRKTGIFPFNRHLFTEADFLGSFVTDRPTAESNESETAVTSPLLGTSTSLGQSTSASQSTSVDQTKPAHRSTLVSHSTPAAENNSEPTGSEKSFKTPAMLKGYPKADPRKNNRKRKAGRSMIATDTPEKSLIEETALLVAAKKSKPFSKKRQQATKDLFSKNSSDHEESDEDDVMQQWSDNSSEDVAWASESDHENSLEGFNTPIDSVKMDQFVLVEFVDKKKKIYYVGKIIKEKDDQNYVQISFLRKTTKLSCSFYFPQVEDIASVHMQDIKFILPPPDQNHGTKRLKSYFKFEVSFSNLDVR